MPTGCWTSCTDGTDALIVPKRDAAALAARRSSADRATRRWRRGWPPRRGAPARATTSARSSRKMERLYELLHETSRRDQARGRPARPTSAFLHDGDGDDRARRTAATRAARRVCVAARAQRRRRRSACVLLAWALTVDFPKSSLRLLRATRPPTTASATAWPRTSTSSIRREDLVRVWREFPSGPEGIFLKRGTRRPDLRARRLAPRSCTLDVRPDARYDRLYYAKAFIYPLFAAPFVWLFGTNGFLVLHALLMTLVLRVRLRVPASRAASRSRRCSLPARSCSSRWRRSTWCG